MILRLLYIISLSLMTTTIITAQSSSNMNLIGTWSGSTSACTYGGTVCYNEVWGYVDGSGNEYAVICSPEEVHFIDLSTPSSPTLKNTFTGTGQSTWRDVKSYGNYVYVVHDNNNNAPSTDEGLWIFDMSALPSGNVVDLGFLKTDFGRSHNIFIDEPNARLYVAGSNTESTGMIVYSLANPAAPSLLASVDLSTGTRGGYVHDLYVRDHIAYCNSESGADGVGGMFALDFTDPTSPSYLADINEGGYNHSSWMTDDGSHVVFATETQGAPLYIVDVTDVPNGNFGVAKAMQHPLLAPMHMDNTAHNPLIRGNFCFVSYYEDGVQVWDISDPTNPSIAGYYDMIANTSYSGTSGVWGVYPFLPSGNILVSEESTGLYVLRTTFALPVELTEFTARIMNNSEAILTWETESEENSREFIVEKSKDGKDFEILGHVPAQGNSTEPTNYDFIDDNPFEGDTYYRLKIVDLDETYEYSDIKVVKLIARPEITLSPNPMLKGSELLIRIQDGEDDVLLNIYNVSGQLVLSSNEKIINENIVLMPNILDTGIYFIEIGNGSEKVREKLIVVGK